jgi:putative hydrolase of the HAD superfamily
MSQPTEEFVTASPMLPRASEIEAISLDLDDTLWPVVPALVAAEEAMHRWLAERAPRTAMRCSIDRLREMRVVLAMANAEQAHDMGWLRLESLRQALRESGDDPALAVGAFQEFMDGRQRVTLYGEVEELLQRWKSRYQLVVVTNGNADIERIGIGHYFAASIAAHEVGFGKPDRRIFEHACASIGVLPGRVLHIGDDLELDVLGARGAGLHAAWLLRPDLHHQRTSRTSDADAGLSQAPEPAYQDLREIEQALAGS